MPKSWWGAVEHDARIASRNAYAEAIERGYDNDDAEEYADIAYFDVVYERSYFEDGDDAVL